MPKRKRRGTESTSAPRPQQATATTDAPDQDAPIAVDPNVALFARRHQEELDRQKQAQRDAAEQRKKDAAHGDLVAAKDQAVARVKALRRRDRVAPGETAEADAAYKAALAALIEFETGAPPPWAAAGAPPEVPAEEEPEE